MSRRRVSQLGQLRPLWNLTVKTTTQSQPAKAFSQERIFVPELHLHHDGVLLFLVDLHPLRPEHTQLSPGSCFRRTGQQWRCCSPGYAGRVCLSAEAWVLRGVEGSGGPGVVGGQGRRDGRRGRVFKGGMSARRLSP